MPYCLLVWRPIVQPIQRVTAASIGLLDRVAPEHLVEDVIRKVAAVAAVEEQPDRFEGLVGGIRDRGHRDRPGGFGLFVHRAKEAPGVVLGGGDGLLVVILVSFGLIVATPV